MSYEAKVTALTNVREHPTADRLQLATVAGYQIVIGLDNYEGELGIFFPCDGQLSEEFANANDLVERRDLVTGERAGGFFAKNRRVRSQRLRQQKSDGFWTGLDSLKFTGVDISTLHEGYAFDTINGVPICNKYYTPATLRQMKNQIGKARKELVMFAKHVDTKKFQYDADEWLVPGAIVYITEKVHGTSARNGFVVDTEPKKKRWYHKLFRREPGEVSEWRFVTGTRNIVLRDPKNQGFYEDESFRLRAAEPLRDNLHRGEVIYYEIVGYAGPETPIMASQDTKDLKDVKAAYGPKMNYTYGCLPGGHESYVYRITSVNEDGDATELSWPQVKARCAQLGIKPVPELSRPILVSDQFTVGYQEATELATNDHVKKLVSYLEEGPSTLDERHIREGVVIRIERPDGEVGFLKSKSFTFGVLEGYLKNLDDYVDTEEIA